MNTEQLTSQQESQKVNLAISLEQFAEYHQSPFSTHLVNEFGVMVDDSINTPEVWTAIAELGIDTNDETLATQAFYMQDARGKLDTQLAAVNRGNLMLAATWDGAIHGIKLDAMNSSSSPDWMMTVLLQELRRKVADGDEVEDRIEDTVGEIHMLASKRAKEIKKLDPRLADAVIDVLGHMGTEDGNAEKLTSLIRDPSLLAQIEQHTPLYQILHGELSDKNVRALRRENKRDSGYLELVALAVDNSSIIKNLRIRTNLEVENYPNLSYEDRQSLETLRRHLDDGKIGSAYRIYASEILLKSRPDTYRPWYEENEKPKRWEDATDPVPQVLGSIMMCQNMGKINAWCEQVVSEVESKLKIIEENNGYINHKRTVYDTPPKDLKVLHGHLLVEATEIPDPDLQLQYLLKINQAFKENGSRISAKTDIQRAWRTCKTMRTPLSEDPDMETAVLAA